tara:strand:- start:495 stop:815 length:321 start_codon:yes stop_codon:yes gene_type:complete
MAATRELGATYSATVETTAEQTAFNVYRSAQAQRGFTLFAYASAAGSLKTYWVTPDGAERLLDTTAVAATTTTFTDFDYSIPGQVKVTWTSDSGSSLTVEVECVAY